MCPEPINIKKLNLPLCSFLSFHIHLLVHFSVYFSLYFSMYFSLLSLLYSKRCSQFEFNHETGDFTKLNIILKTR